MQTFIIHPTGSCGDFILVDVIAVPIKDEKGAIEYSDGDETVAMTKQQIQAIEFYTKEDGDTFRRTKLSIAAFRKLQALEAEVAAMEPGTALINDLI